MKIYRLVFTTVLAAVCYTALGQKEVSGEIKQLLENQRMAWNAGDIPRFMQDYWKSESLKFIGKSGVVCGWEATHKRYQKAYPDRQSMGILTFDELKIERLGRKNVWVLGRWQLSRPEKGDVGGYFTLLMRKIHGEWKIVADHTS